MKRVLFVCIGNCCRSQIAEGFARAYGSDVMEASSAGLSPTPQVAPETIATMAEKGIDISGHFPKPYDPRYARADLIVNLSGGPLPGPAPAEVRTWKVEDPFQRSRQVYQRCCQEIENHVMQLILELRRAQR